MSDNDKTVAKTIWSETVIELLCMSLEKNRPDEEIKELLKQCQGKGFRTSYLIEKVKKMVDEKAAARVRSFLK